MLFNQVKAIVLAMQAIRNINPEAQLIQTEDLSKIHSTTFYSTRQILRMKDDG